MSDPRASIIIRCYNEEQHIGRLLSGIMQQEMADFEIIVVDSGSTDATVAIASRFPTKIVSIRPEAFSFGRSLNLGCAAASGDFLVFASAHVYPVYHDWLSQMLAPFADERVALTYGKQRGDETTKFSEHRIFATWFPDGPAGIQDHPFCNNANAAIRRSVWVEQPYDEILTGLEDLDWARRAMDQGHRIAYVPAAEIIHVHNETAQRTFNRYRREAMALKRVFPDERFSFWEFVRLLLANTGGDYYHAWQDGVFWSNVRAIPIFRLMQFWGTYRGFRQRPDLSARLKQAFYYPSLARAGGSQSNDRALARIDYGEQVPLDSPGDASHADPQ